MYSPEAFNPFWVGQPDSSYGRSRMGQYSSDYNSYGDNGHNRSDVGGGSVVQRECAKYFSPYNYSGDYMISDNNEGYAFNKAYGVERFAGGADGGSLDGGFDRRSIAGVQQERPTRSRGSYFSFGYDNSSSPFCYMR